MYLIWPPIRLLIFNDFLYVAVASTVRNIDARQAELNSYYRGLARALKTIREQPEIYFEWASAFFSDLDPDLFKRAFASNSRIYVPDPRLTETQFGRAVEFLNKQNTPGTDSVVPPSFAFKDWADQRFADAYENEKSR
jgi:NitT/TauT family transport system substrate-binding protein